MKVYKYFNTLKQMVDWISKVSANDQELQMHLSLEGLDYKIKGHDKYRITYTRK